MSGLFAIVPVKPLAEGKSRLRAILSDHARLAFNTFLMKRAFELTAEFPGPARTVVVSRSECVLWTARRRGMIAIAEREGGLNTALADATAEAIVRGADGVFVLPVDLPLARSAMVRELVAGATHDFCVLVPDRHGTGTNFLALFPPRCDLYRFGPGSLRLHHDAASEKGLRTVLSRHEALSFDLDEAVDYRRWKTSVAEPVE